MQSPAPLHPCSRLVVRHHSRQRRHPCSNAPTTRPCSASVCLPTPTVTHWQVHGGGVTDRAGSVGAGLSRLANASAAVGAAAASPATSGSPGAEAPPLQQPAPGSAAQPPAGEAAAAATAQGDEDSDVDIGSQPQPPIGSPLNLSSPSPVGKRGQPGAGADVAAGLPKWQGAGSKARHQVSRRKPLTALMVGIHSRLCYGHLPQADCGRCSSVDIKKRLSAACTVWCLHPGPPAAP
jgi:hypothetical protein